MTSASSLPGTLQRAASSLSVGSLSSSVGLSISFLPSVPFVESLYYKLSVNIQSFRVPLDRAVREVLVPSIRANFDQGGRPPWEALAPATLAFREFYGYGGESPLIRTGTLRRVATQINMWDVTREDASYKALPAKVWYGQVQNDGYEVAVTKSAKSEVFAPIKTPDQIRASGMKVTSKWDQRMARINAALDSGKVINTGSTKEARTAAPIPARPFMMIQQEDELKIQAIFEEWLDMRIAAVKF